MNKRIRTGFVSMALITGSFIGAGVVSAQVDDTVPTDTTADTTVEAPADTTTEAPTEDQPVDDATGRRGHHTHRSHHVNRGAQVEATAELLGIEVDELRAALQGGLTLAEIAEANGVDPQTIIDAKVAAITERINAAVEAGRFTADEAADKLVDVEERITTRVNEGRPERGERPGRGQVGADAPAVEQVD